jgi:hypothetical protein
MPDDSDETLKLSSTKVIHKSNNPRLSKLIFKISLNALFLIGISAVNLLIVRQLFGL